MKNLKRALLSITLATMPLVEVFFINLGIPIKIYQISLLLLIGVELIDRNKRQPDIPSRLIWLGVTFLLISILSSVLGWFELSQIGGWPNWASGARMTPSSFLIEIVYLVMNFIFFTLIAKHSAEDENSMKDLIFWIACGAIVPALLTINQLVGLLRGEALFVLEKASEREDIILDIVPRFSSSFQEPNHYAAYLSVVIPIMLGALGIFKKEDRRKMVLVISLVLSFLGLLLSRSTIGLFSTAIVTLYFLIRAESKAFLIGFGVILFSVLLFIAQSGDFELILELELENTFAKMQGSTGSLETRLKEIEYAYELFISHPIFGVGLSHYGLFCAVKLGVNESIKLSINNVYLYILSQTGMLGFACFSIFIYLLQKPLLFLNRTMHESWHQMNLLYSSLLISILLIFFAASSPLSPYFWAAFGLITGWGMTLEKMMKPQRESLV
ncbi:MAG: O-antigen ligase family protein [Chloroherpetonaceae bacterium]|nr:O-antigen ligase family protein [Chloroherpetonaceae bacterium]